MEKLLLRILLSPFIVFYYLIVKLRNFLFDISWLKSKSFPVPVISIGNLCTGGAGKTPHTEYVARLIIENELSPVAILSRGYKRKTKGFIIVEDSHTHLDVGDEPLQYKRRLKNENVIIVVDANRRRGIKNIIEMFPDIKAIVLDDAFQHRYVKSGLNIMLTDFYEPYFKDCLFPIGNLREPRSGAKRADIIIVTKSPRVVSPLTKRYVYNKTRLAPHQSLCFSKIEYSDRISANYKIVDNNKKLYSFIFMFTGIVNPYPLKQHLKSSCLDIVLFKFPDHHTYTKRDIEKILNSYNNHLSKNKIIVTTEKDLMRLESVGIMALFENYPIYYVPIIVEIDKQEKEEFNNKIIQYVKKNQRNS